MKTVNLIIIFVIGLFNSSMATDRNILLDRYDFFLEESSNVLGPPIQIWNDKDELMPSFNQWMCFSSAEASFTCSEHMFENIVKTPMVAVYSGDEALEIETSTSESEDIDCEETLEEWRELLNEQETFCVLAAYLQDLAHENYEDSNARSLWILDAFKTQKGYWLGPSLQSRLQ